MSDLAIKLPVSPEDMTITRDGIEPYLWPIQHSDLIDFGQNLEAKLSKFLREYPDQEQAVLHKIASKNYVTSICTCFQGDLLSQRFEKNNLILDAPSNWDVWPNIFQGEAPPRPFYLDALKAIKKEKTFFQKITTPGLLKKAIKKLSFKKGELLTIEGLKVTPYPKKGGQKFIVATQRLPLISRHAGTVQESVYLYGSQRWFVEVSDELLADKLVSQDDSIDKAVIEIIKDCYKDSGVVLSKSNEQYLYSVLAEYITLIKIHMDRLKEVEDLPQILWTGTGGHVWDVMARCEVKRRGGKVIAHDHGGGVPHLNHPEKGWVEMWSCDEFMTYSEEQANTFTKFMKEWPNLDVDLPKITFVASQYEGERFGSENRLETKDTGIKNIRIFSTIYSSEEGRGLPIYPHIAYIDWQARLISKLQDEGYNVSFKPHPESRLKTPSSFSSVLKADVIEDPLDQMDKNFDLYIFDLSNTSVLQTALMTDKPIVIVDFGVMEWRQDAFDLFQKRCGYLKGFYKDNRMCVDWEELNKQIKLAAQRFDDHKFASSYYF